MSTTGSWLGWRHSTTNMGKSTLLPFAHTLIASLGVREGRTWELQEPVCSGTNTKNFLYILNIANTNYRTILNREPVLGSQRLDLLKVYKLVTAHGGCEKVSVTY
jgi:hypothetical protein